MQNKIISTLIADDQQQLISMINRVKDIVEIFQLDIMDGIFVPNSSNNFDFKLPEINRKFEAHLMVNDPEGWIKKHGGKVDTIIVHIESTKQPQKIIDRVKNLGKKIGLGLNPETSLDTIIPFLGQIDQVLIMTVNPGYYGSPFLPEMIEKIKKLRKIAPSLVIEADGSINEKTAFLLKDAGVNLFCTGSYLMKAKDRQQAGDTLKNLIN